jgi:hypothetical protein
MSSYSFASALLLHLLGPFSISAHFLGVLVGVSTLGVSVLGVSVFLGFSEFS